MRILEVVHTFLPDYYGGTEVLVSNLSKELAKKHKVDVLYTKPVSDSRSYSVKKHPFEGYNGWEIHKDIRKYTQFKDLYIDKEIDKLFAKALKKLRPQVIHFHHLFHLSANLPEVARKHNIPTVLTMHDFWLQCLTTKRVYHDGSTCRTVNYERCVACAKEKVHLAPRGPNKMDRFKEFFLKKETEMDKIKKRKKILLQAVDNCDLIIAPTKFLYKEFIKWGIPERKMIYSADGIDDSYFKKIDKTYSTNFRFSFIGTAIPEKGLDVAIEAFNKVNLPNAVFNIYADLKHDKEYVKSLKKSSKDNPNIVFKKTFPPEEIGKVFKEIDCFIMPSVWFENAPLVIKNAILSKTPVIASDIPGVRDNIFDGKNGLLFKIGDSNELRLKMKQIVDDKEYSRIVRNIKKIKTAKDNARELANIYKILSRV